MFTGSEAKLVDIAQLRSGQGISQALLSARSGINRYRLSQLECRYDEPSEAERSSVIAALLAIVRERRAAFYAALQELK